MLGSLKPTLSTLPDEHSLPIILHQQAICAVQILFKCNIFELFLRRPKCLPKLLTVPRNKKLKSFISFAFCGNRRSDGEKMKAVDSAHPQRRWGAGCAPDCALVAQASGSTTQPSEMLPPERCAFPDNPVRTALSTYEWWLLNRSKRILVKRPSQMLVIP